MPTQLSYGFTSSWILQSACAGNRTANRQADELARIRSDDDEDDDNSGSLGLRFKFNVRVKVFLLLSLSILVFKV